MKIMVNLFASFRCGRFKSEVRSYHVATAIREIVAELGIPAQDLGMVLRNGGHVSVDMLVREGDTISLLPRIGGG